MNDRENRENEMLIRVKDFFAQRAADFSTNTIALPKITRIGQIIAEVQTQDQTEIASAGSAGQNYDVAEDAADDLRDELRDIADFARSMAQENNGLEQKFRMPRTGSKRNLIAVANVFAQEAEALESQFIAFGMDAGFIDALRDKIKALEDALSAAYTAKESRLGASSEIPVLLREGKQIVRFLDPIVRRKYRNDVSNLTAWIHASHIRRASKSNTPTPPP